MADDSFDLPLPPTHQSVEITAEDIAKMSEELKRMHQGLPPSVNGIPLYGHPPMQPDHPVFDLAAIPLPITHQSFEFTAKDIPGAEDARAIQNRMMERAIQNAFIERMMQAAPQAGTTLRREDWLEMDRAIIAAVQKRDRRMEPLRRHSPITADFPDGPPLGSVVASRDNPGVRYKILNINKHWVRTSEWAVPVPSTHWDRYGRGVVDRSPDQMIVNYQRRDWDDQMRRWVLIERPPSVYGYTNYPTRRTVDELREAGQDRGAEGTVEIGGLKLNVTNWSLRPEVIEDLKIGDEVGGTVQGFNWWGHATIPFDNVGSRIGREDDQPSIREQFRQYQDGLRRYITLTGITPAQVIANPQIVISDKTIVEIDKPEETP